MIDKNRYNIYQDKNGRLIAYDKIEKKNISYPRIIMEDYLGRKLLKTEHVHHIDMNPLNNDISNLEVVNGIEHQRMHGLYTNRNKKYFDKVVNCKLCKKEFLWTGKQQEDFQRNKHTSEKNGKEKHGPFCSKKCAGIYATLIQYKKI